MTEYTSGEFYLLSARGVSYFCVLLRKQGTARGRRSEPSGLARAACLEPMAVVFAIGVAVNTVKKIGTITTTQNFMYHYCCAT